MSVCITMHNCIFVGFPAPCHECSISKVSTQIHYSLVIIIKLLLCEYNLLCIYLYIIVIQLSWVLIMYIDYIRQTL